MFKGGSKKGLTFSIEILLPNCKHASFYPLNGEVEGEVIEGGVGRLERLVMSPEKDAVNKKKGHGSLQLRAFFYRFFFSLFATLIHYSFGIRDD